MQPNQSKWKICDNATKPKQWKREICDNATKPKQVEKGDMRQCNQTKASGKGRYVTMQPNQSKWKREICDNATKPKQVDILLVDYNDGNIFQKFFKWERFSISIPSKLTHI